MAECVQILEIDGQPTCRVANHWAEGRPVPVNESACKMCVGCSVPRGINRVTVSLAIGQLAKVAPAIYRAKLADAAPHLVSPGAPEKLVRYVQATADWVKAGRPTRTDGEVAQILEICQACPEWLAEKGSCRLCGCYINSGTAWTNKARRLNEHCPQEKW